ncbi:hypothetical protein [Xanthomonas sp. NCPPB 2632]|uniref:hypothetical protein n=1 Tax=Xanthomonas sp. NCPPB 2632 TaxID=3240912 RepID=UPI0035136C96
MIAISRQVTYGRIRRAHFRKGLAAAVKGLDKTTIVLGCVFGPGAILLFIGLLVGIADRLTSLTDPSSAFSSRVLAILSWQAAMFGLLWAMRNLLFMRHADAFFASLPISKRAVLGMDMAIGVKCCALLWLPLLWLAGTTIVARPAAEGAFACFSLGMLAFSGLLSNLLALRKRYVQAMAAFLPSMAVMSFTPMGMAGALAAATSTLLALGMIEKYSGISWRKPSSQPSVRRLYDRLSMSSGMVLPFLFHHLRETALVRVMTMVAAFAVSILLVQWKGVGPQMALATMTCMGALFATLLYRLPAITRLAVYERMSFLAGQPGFRRRVGTYSIIVPGLSFIAVMAIAYVFVLCAVYGVSTAGVKLAMPIGVFTGLFVIGVLGSLKWLEFVTWFMPVANIAAALIILMSKLT